MSDPDTPHTQQESNLSRDRLVRVAILAAAFVFVVLYVFVL